LLVRLGPSKGTHLFVWQFRGRRSVLPRPTTWPDDR
jgi:hypothetical protein